MVIVVPILLIRNQRRARKEQITRQRIEREAKEAFDRAQAENAKRAAERWAVEKLEIEKRIEAARPERLRKLRELGFIDPK
jgi:hypothetical protein